MKIKIIVLTNRVGSKDERTIEIDYEDILGLSDEDAEEYINECVVGEMLGDGLINWTWEVVDHE